MDLLTRRRRLLVLWGLALVALVGVVVLLPQLSTMLSGQQELAPPDGRRGHLVRDISAARDLQQAFNEDPGRVRVVLLLSPT